jgi:hypothetical protein
MHAFGMTRPRELRIDTGPPSRACMSEAFGGPV